MPPSLLAAGAAALVAIAAILVIALHVLPTGLDPTRNPVSQYGRTAFARLYRAQVIVSGAGSLLLLLALLSAGVQRPLPLVALAYGLARVAIAWNPMDLPGEAPTPAGRNHGLLAVVAFAGLAAASVPISDTLDRVATIGLSGVLAPVAIAVPVTAVLMVGSTWSPELRRRFGTFERLFYAAAFAWLFLAAVSLVFNVSPPALAPLVAAPSP
jgi:Protein of unknown function (DUF998)